MSESDQMVSALRTLQSAGMSNEQLRALHHLPKRKTTFASATAYFGGGKELRDDNQQFARRVVFVANQILAGERDLGALIQRALRQWPLGNRR